MHFVRETSQEDFEGWLFLAREVEPLFGPMADRSGFTVALRESIRNKRAFCIESTNSDNQGNSLAGGVIISTRNNEIMWLAVSQNQRRQGCGRLLLEYALNRLDKNRPVTVRTFDKSVLQGIPARKLYLKYGFNDVKPADRNPAGYPTVVMQKF